MKRIPAATLLVLVSACAPMEWARTDGSAAELEQDLQQCEQAAWREASLQSFRYFGTYGPFMYRDPFGDRFLEETRLANFCMRAKGYELAPVEK